MSQRSQRARLLAPSFLIVTTTWACGKTLWHSDAEPGSRVVGAGGTSFEPAPKCPTSLPTRDEPCGESQRCEYAEPDPACGGVITNYRVAECVDGAWTESFLRIGGSCNPPGPMPPMPPTVCPAEMPALGSACPPSYSPSACSYQLPECTNPIAVVCNGTWQSRDVCISVVGAGGAGQGGAGGEASGGAGEVGGAGGAD